ncbi:diacylglycerol/lipid kinase family protein [Deinococcus multiflagellatus]|uniref:diacylglycerol/lipid kinase family protein n=1 Tax=Deinococcus multiflagellatus TaxID=1656887 RepID=UPI001CCA04C7|nr:diacylglycerol kinase family protein [Deinococcus multiflagellatus]MBZ9715992.1 diacylglycerol kinase family lipid kinase [Deinococcus multiflagellatus]
MTAATGPSPTQTDRGHATLIYNANAGGSGHCTPEDLVGVLHGLGFQPVCRATTSEDELQEALATAQGPVFVAGGDGTVRAVALQLAGRPGVVLGIVPMGTANNVARTLGIQGAPLDILASYGAAQVQPFDLGRVTAPWGQDLFLEACGCGAFADVLAEYDPESGKSPLRAVQALTTALTSFDPPPLSLTVDGQTAPPTAFALLEVMNTRATGPRLRLATHADPGDGQLDVVRIDAGGREGLLAYLAALARDEFDALSSVESSRAAVVDIPYSGQAFHIDAEVRPPVPGAAGVVRVEAWPGALQVLVPQQGEG